MLLYGTFPSQLGHSGCWRMAYPKEHGDGKWAQAGLCTQTHGHVFHTSPFLCFGSRTNSDTVIFTLSLSTLQPSPLLCMPAVKCKHTPDATGILPRVEQGNHAAAPLARLIKPAHLGLILHLEQVVASPAEPSSPPLPTRHHVTALLNSSDCKRKHRLRLCQ